jgi:hypothetical protein
MAGEDPGPPICDANGVPIQLTQEEYEAALEAVQANRQEQQQMMRM